MRLNRFDTSKIKVRGGGRGARRAGGIGCGTLIIAIIGAVVFGVDPTQTIGMLGDGNQATSGPQAQQGGQTEEELCTSGLYAREACDALQSLNETWEPEFASAGAPFEQPELVLYPPGPVNTGGCGTANSATGPFYCPADYGIYIETSFFDQLASMSGTRGDFARLYVMAHEYAHHVQKLTGLMDQVRSAQRRNPSQANRLLVRLELHADCYAGVWAGKNRDRIEPGDLEEGLRAASSVGDDTLQRNAGQRINPDTFTHGTSRQRMEALRLGVESGNARACDSKYFS